MRIPPHYLLCVYVSIHVYSFCVDNFVLVLPSASVSSDTSHTHSHTHTHTSNNNIAGSKEFRSNLNTWINHSLIRNVTLIDRPHSLIGVAETWNLIITAHDQAPWYAICAHDVMFFPGQLREFSRRFWRESGLLRRSKGRGNSKSKSKSGGVNFAHTKWLNLPGTVLPHSVTSPPCVLRYSLTHTLRHSSTRTHSCSSNHTQTGNRGFNFFALTREVVQAVGLFDENIFPAFWEDRDYQYRLGLWDGARIRTFKNVKLWHGVDVSAEEQGYYRVGSGDRDDVEEEDGDGGGGGGEVVESSDGDGSRGDALGDVTGVRVTATAGVATDVDTGSSPRREAPFERNNITKNGEYVNSNGLGWKKVSSSVSVSSVEQRDSSSNSSGSGMRRYNYTSGTVYLGVQWLRTMQLASDRSINYLMRKWGCNRTLTEKYHHLMYCKHTHPFGNPLLGLDHWQLNQTSIQEIREFYDNSSSSLSSGDHYSSDGTQESFVARLSDSLNVNLSPRKRSPTTYSFAEVRRYHHSRRSKVIMAHKKRKNNGATKSSE